MSDRSPKTVRCGDNLWNRFEKYAVEKEGKKAGAKPKHLEIALREYMDEGRTARIERRVNALHDRLDEVLSEKSLERERRKSDGLSSPVTPTSPGNKTEERLTQITQDLPEHTVVSEAMIETPIEMYAGSSPKTLEKYKRLLKKRGHILPHPFDTEKYMTSQRQFAVFCEHSEKVTSNVLDQLVGMYEDLFDNDEWYLEALPNDFIEGNELKYDTIADSSAYRESNDLLDDDRDRGVQ